MQHKLGQYFTTNDKLKEVVYNFVLNKPDKILEPSIGQGDLVLYFLMKNKRIVFDMYEIDKTIILLDGIEKKDVVYNDFMKEDIKCKYKTIIGNPPYVKTKKGNLYIDFIYKCYGLLKHNGELVFIIPSDFFKLTSASKILNDMMKNGTFTHIYHPHDEHLFKNASIDIIVFRYCKNKKLLKEVIYNDKITYITNSDGLITFDENKIDNEYKISDFFDIYVGLVSGKEQVFRNETYGNIKILNKENKCDDYIYIKKYPSDNDELNKYLLQNKDVLIKRKIRKFNETNWFEFGALRNIKIMEQYKNEDCIYCSNISRKEKIAFVDKVMYFGGGLIMLKPKNKDVSLEKMCDYMNSSVFKNKFTFSGRFKIGHRQLSKSFIDSNIIMK